MENYPGVTIDQKFPIIENHDFTDREFQMKSYSVKAEEFQIGIRHFAPKTISKNDKVIFKFKTLYQEGYWSSLVGISHLLGENSKEIYTVASGTGGVCCTNYWITDVSGEKPRNIFRSEDYGEFRDPMEIFDAEGDGIYEIVQFDSAFRYFMGDCGSCSPEPRAVFKYDKKKKEYLPAKGIQQDFVKESFIETEKWLAETQEKIRKETYEKLEKEKNLGIVLDLHQNLLSHTVDLIYIGEEEKAWEIFDKYFPKNFDKEETRAEIKNRLRDSKFYQALKKTS